MFNPMKLMSGGGFKDGDSAFMETISSNSNPHEFSQDST